MNLSKIHNKYIDRKLKANQHTTAVIGTGGGFVVPDNGLDEAAHDALDHTGLTGIMDETAHDALDHTGLTGIADTFLELTDTPAAYTGEGSKIVAVKADVSGLEFVAAPAAENGVPVGGTENQLAAKNSATDYDIKWVDAPAAANGLPAGGTAGQVLAKVDADDYDCQWIDNTMLIAETTVAGTDATSVQFTGLDGDAHGGYLLIATVENAISSTVDLGLFVNGDTTTTNYYYQYLLANNTTVSGGRGNTGSLITINASDKTAAFVNINRVAGIFTALATVSRAIASASGIMLIIRNIAKSAATTNITQLDLVATSANAIKVGSKFSLYRRK